MIGNTNGGGDVDGNVRDDAKCGSSSEGYKIDCHG